MPFDSPFEELLQSLPGWTLAFTVLEGVMGFTDTTTSTIWISLALNARQRRSTIVHEIVHALRGDTTDDPEAEQLVQIETARRLIGSRALELAFTWTGHPEDIADALDVDLGTLRTRLRHLGDDESARICRALMSGTSGSRPGAHNLCILSRWWREHSQPDPMPCRHSRCQGIVSAPKMITPLTA